MSSDISNGIVNNFNQTCNGNKLQVNSFTLSLNFCMIYAEILKPKNEIFN